MKSVKIQIPEHLTAEQRADFAEDAIRLILERTADGRDVDGNAFAAYSDWYAGSKDFKNAGKSKNRVNLRLTEEMMNSIELISHRSGEIEIGFTNEEASQKAEWAEADDNGPVRRFLGLSEEERSSLLSNFPVTDRTLREISPGLLERILRVQRS